MNNLTLNLLERIALFGAFAGSAIPIIGHYNLNSSNAPQMAGTGILIASAIALNYLGKKELENIRKYEKK